MDRFKAPSDAIDLSYFISKQDKPIKFEPIPTISFSLGINSSVDGSAFLEYNGIKTVCSVCGPFELKQDGQLVTHFKFAPFSSQVRRDNSKESEEKRLSQLLLAALEPSVILDSFPRGKFIITVTVLDDGTTLREGSLQPLSCLSAGITCATLALVNAGVQMYDLAIGLDIDPSPLRPKESRALSKTCCIAVLSQLQQITMFEGFELEIHRPSDLKKVLDAAFERAEKVYATIRSILYHAMKEQFEAIKVPK